MVDLRDMMGNIEIIRLRKRVGNDLVTGAKFIHHQPLKDPTIRESTTWNMRIPNFFTDHNELMGALNESNMQEV